MAGRLYSNARTLQVFMLAPDGLDEAARAAVAEWAAGEWPLKWEKPSSALNARRREEQEDTQVSD